MPYAIPPNMLAKFGRHGDTMVAHITRKEAEKLAKDGGSWTKNPWTGLPEFWEGADTNGMSDTAMGDSGMGFGGDTSMGGPGGYDANFGGYGLGGIDTVSDAEARSVFGDLSRGPELGDVMSGMETVNTIGDWGDRALTTLGKWGAMVSGAKLGGVLGATALTPFGLTALGYGLGTVGGAWTGKSAFNEGFTAPTSEQTALAEGIVGSNREGGDGDNDGYVGAIPRTEQIADPYASLKKLYFSNALTDKYTNRQQRVSLMGYGIPYARR